MSSSSMYEEPPTARTNSSKKKTPSKTREPLKAPSILQRIFHRVNQSDSIYYATKGKSVDPSNTRDVLTESTPFKFPEDLEQFSFKVVQKEWKDKLHRQEQRTKYCDRTNVKSRQTADLLKRLYVEEPDELKGMKTLLDIDPEFYTIVEGRPNMKLFSMSIYLENIRSSLRTKLMAGFRNDEMLLIEEKLKREQAAIENVRKKYLLYMESFENFLNQDYDESIMLLHEADGNSLKTQNKCDEIRKLHTQNAALEFEVHKLEDRWRDLKMYQKFLYFVSPMSWRKKFDYIHRKELNEDLDTEPSSIFKKYTLSSQGHIPSLNNLVDEYLECIQHEEEPVLYFTTTDELTKVFRFIEIQNLNCLLHTEEIELPMENMRIIMEEAKKSLEKEAHTIQNMIDGLAGGIEWEEECANNLKDMAMKHIEGTFRKLISDDEILKLHVLIEDVYESCIAKNDSDLTIYDMMMAIEKSYNILVLQLDGLPQNIVKKSEKFRFAEQAKLAKLCEETAQKIALVDSITWRLKKSLEPPFQKKRELKWRSAPPRKPELPPPPPRQLTKKEEEYLSFFTVYCAHLDKVDDYGIDLSSPETDFKKISIMNLNPEEPEFKV